MLRTLINEFDEKLISEGIFKEGYEYLTSQKGQMCLNLKSEFEGAHLTENFDIPAVEIILSVYDDFDYMGTNRVFISPIQNKLVAEDLTMFTNDGIMELGNILANVLNKDIHIVYTDKIITIKYAKKNLNNRLITK